MGKKRSLQSLREYVDGHPRKVTQRQIARKLGISESWFSYLLGGVRPGPEIADKLREHGIDPYAEVREAARS